MVFILHPYGDVNPRSGWYGDRIPRDTAPTWAFLADVGSEVGVIHVKVERDRYPRQVAEYWGRDDIVYLEDDKLPTAEDLDDILRCPHKFCMFPYPSSLGGFDTVEKWTAGAFPFGLGFCKFTLEAQEACPPSTWPFDKFLPTQCDKIIETPLIEKFGPMPLHPRMIAHNHWPTFREQLRQGGKAALKKVGL